MNELNKSFLTPHGVYIHIDIVRVTVERPFHFLGEKKGLPLAAETCLCTDVEFWEVGTAYKGSQKGGGGGEEVGKGV